MKDMISLLTEIIEMTGVAVIVIGAVYSFFIFAKRLCSKSLDAYDGFRRSLGRSILLGLELLVAGDIINTVAIEPTIKSVSILGLIVLIRTFLSFSLEIELERRLPWK